MCSSRYGKRLEHSVELSASPRREAPSLRTCGITTIWSIRETLTAFLPNALKVKTEGENGRFDSESIRTRAGANDDFTCFPRILKANTRTEEAGKRPLAALVQRRGE
jgi:hypothetical protein